jgi:hypothetical protein
MKQRLILFTLAAGITLIVGCRDMGSGPEETAPTPPPSGTVSFSQRVLPILTTYGCTGCHGGTSGLTVTTVAGLLAGGANGPAVIAGNADGSNLIKKVSPSPPFGSRMPVGGPFMPDSTIQVIKTWINEGAKNN